MSPSLRGLSSFAALVALAIGGTGCHRIIIDSGLEPAAETYREEWNMAYAYAIYPANIDASQWCGGRFAVVETKHSFLNGVVSNITLGIITPMDVRVVCAAGGMDDGAEAGTAGVGTTSRAVNPKPSR